MIETPTFVSTHWLASHLYDEALVVLEVAVHYDPSSEQLPYADEQAYQKNGHIPGAIFVDLNRWNASEAPVPFTMDKDTTSFLERLAQLGIDEEKRVVVYDRGALANAPTVHADMWASRFAWQCQVAGFDHISILNGGLFKWVNEGRPLATGMEIPETLGHLQPRSPHLEYYADAKTVTEALTDPAVTIIDALSPEQYTGAVCPFGAERAGHIPTAKNLFFPTLTDPTTGALLPDDQLREKLERLALSDLTQPLLIYCGFGIAATYLFQVFKHLGYQQIKVYDGSLLEWARFTNYPLEIGERDE